MKTLLTVVATFLAASALADVPRPTPKPTAPAAPVLTQITEGSHKVRLEIPQCSRPQPGRPVCAVMPSMVLDLALKLNGCLDTAHVSYSIVDSDDNNGIKVVVSALNVENPRSKNVKCAVAPVAVKSIRLGGPRVQSKTVTVEFLKNSAN